MGGRYLKDDSEDDRTMPVLLRDWACDNTLMELFTLKSLPDPPDGAESLRRFPGERGK